jgi:hypothetical protein
MSLPGRNISATAAVLTYKLDFLPTGKADRFLDELFLNPARYRDNPEGEQMKSQKTGRQVKQALTTKRRSDPYPKETDCPNRQMIYKRDHLSSGFNVPGRKHLMAST